MTFQFVQCNLINIRLYIGKTASMSTTGNASSTSSTPSGISTPFRQKLDWYRICQVLAVVAIFGTLYGFYHSNRTNTNSWKDVQYWLKQHKLDNFEPYFKEKGTFSISLTQFQIDFFYYSPHYTLHMH